MLTEGRKRGGKAGTGVGPRSVRLTLGRLTAALESALAGGLIVRNVAKLVTPPALRTGRTVLAAAYRTEHAAGPRRSKTAG